MQLIYTDDIGQVKVGNTMLPGNFDSLEITGTVKIDQVEIPGKDKQATQAVGYEEARIRLAINLLPKEDDGDCSEDIAKIQRLFRASPKQQAPGVYRIVSRHLQARQIDEVIFSDLKTFEDNRSDKVLVICEFMEHVPINVRVATVAQTGSISAPQTQVMSSGLVSDTYRDSTLPKIADTPAVDQNQPGLVKRLFNWIRGGDL